ncbi:translation initiation factor IF-2-like [Elephas maximus indicus]|uniref:translation initiation factor IF-2-like n=1 Tax=Elephas maximus indicus TaxID=99487 RepID=UPI002116C547|nr:translation initiation factor IF-2-like [Elephas maximus indicus]
MDEPSEGCLRVKMEGLSWIKGTHLHASQRPYSPQKEFWLIPRPSDGARVLQDQTAHPPPPAPGNSTPGSGRSSEALSAGVGVVAGARPRSARRGGGARVRGGRSNGTGKRGRPWPGSQGGSVPALRAPRGRLTLLRPGALSRQPCSAAATVAPEQGSGHCRLQLRLRPCAPPRRRPAPPPPRAPRPPGVGTADLRLPVDRPGPPTRGRWPRRPLSVGHPPTVRGAKPRRSQPGLEAAVSPGHCRRPARWARLGLADSRTPGPGPALGGRCERGTCPGGAAWRGAKGPAGWRRRTSPGPQMEAVHRAEMAPSNPS